MSTSEPDPRAILAALGVEDAAAVERVSGGWDTAIWRVERGDERFALRVFRPEQAAMARREAAVMRAAASAGLPVPRVHAEGAWRDRPALLLAWCAGRPLVDELRARPWRVWTLGDAFGRMQARIHAVHAPDALRGRPGAWIDWAGPAEEPLRSRLQAVASAEEALLHLDYHPLNVMAEGARLTGVLDWANARAGDPRADLARTLTILRLTPTPPDVPPLLTLLLRRLLERAWRRGYRQVAGPQRGMGIFYAWAGGVMVRDLAPKIGQPGVWLEPRHLDDMRGWTERWRRRAGLAGG